MFKNILVATDGSEASTHAAKLAVGMARMHDAKLTAVYVVDPYPYLGVGDINPQGFQSYRTAAQQVAARAHAVVDALCKEGGAPVELQARLIEDATATHGILQCATDEGADLIVLGSHGRGVVERLLLGSVATKVVAHATVPVLVTR